MQYNNKQKPVAHNTASRICRISICAALLAAFSQIALPLPSGIPITLQTFAVAFLGFLFGFDGLIALFAYLILGALGVPVFASFKGGFGILIGLTGGFLWGFVLFCLCCVLGNGKKSWFKWILITVGILLCHACGVFQYTLLSQTPIWSAITSISLPFLPKDVLSAFFAFLLSKTVGKALQSAGLKTNLPLIETTDIKNTDNESTNLTLSETTNTKINDTEITITKTTGQETTNTKNTDNETTNTTLTETTNTKISDTKTKNTKNNWTRNNKYKNQ